VFARTLLSASQRVKRERTIEAAPFGEPVGSMGAMDAASSLSRAVRSTTLCGDSSGADHCPLNGSGLDAGQAWIHGCRQLDFHRPILASEVAIAPHGRIA
jgi:hypothetical protein